jgi:hypothetical protein
MPLTSSVMTVSGHDWIVGFAEQLGVSEPSDVEVETLLALAGLAAHASERTAAPISCWIAASAGVSPAEALDAGNRLVERLKGSADG